MNLQFLIFLTCLCLLACNSKEDILAEQERDEYETFCGDVAGGNIDISVDNNNWTTSCVQAINSETITNAYEQKILYVYAYNYGITFFTDTDIEVAWVVWVETTIDGETTVEKTATFYKGFYDYSRALVDPDYSVEDISVYTSDSESMEDSFDITSWDENSVSGNLDFRLYEENTNEQIRISGNFTANIVE